MANKETKTNLSSEVVARDEDNVTLRKDFIRCWLHANPRVSREKASELYDALCERYPNMTRGGHRGMVGREQPWENITHECPCCGLRIKGAQNIKEAFGLRLYTYETKTKGTQKKLYYQSNCPDCRSLSPEERQGNGNVRINPEVQKYYTNQSDARQ